MRTELTLENGNKIVAYLSDQDLKDAMAEMQRKETKVFVPKEIKINSMNDDYGSARIINSQGWRLWKSPVNKVFSVNGLFGSDNQGNNYYLEKVKKPEPNKLYFVTDQEDFSLIGYLIYYKIYLSETEYCYWNDKSIMVTESGWNHYYEVKKVE